MILSTLVIAMGIVLLIPVRMSETPQALGLVVVVATALIALACGLHLSAILAQLRLAGPARALLTGAGWIGIGAGVTWAISRAPGAELVVLLMIAPTAIGVAGIATAPAGRRWHGAPFLGLAIGLALLLLPAWLVRQGG